MLYELRTYQLAVGGLPEYLEVARTKILPGVAEYWLKPVGFWHTEIGPLNEVVHLWAYADLNERQGVRPCSSHHRQWLESTRHQCETAPKGSCNFAGTVGKYPAPGYPRRCVQHSSVVAAGAGARHRR